MNILGIGHAGCRIAKQFENFPQYNAFFIDVKNTENRKNFFNIEQQETHEEYEKNYRDLDLKNIKGETTVVLAGSGKITGILLRLLEQLKDRKLKVLYVKPDLTTCSEKGVLRENLVFGILQQYARSNLLSRLYTVSNTGVEAVLEKIFIPTYWEDINKAIASTYHMLNVFENTEPLLNTFSEPGPTFKIATLGVVNYETLKEKLFYDLERPRLKKYFFGISEKTLNEEKDLLQKIRTYIREKSGEEEKCVACFGIFPTNYEQDYGYTVQYASLIQEEKSD
jgi:hypothetical protein